ncbi:MAG: sialate O-acetylesterase [Terrimicrobiaceae bacterium]
MKKPLLSALFIAALIVPLSAFARLEVSSFFSNHMVLQREQPVPVWGKASPGEEVKVTFRDSSASTKADTSGNWLAELPPLFVGDPGTLEIKSGDTTLAFKDVLVGEVWICSGQSNMEWPLKKANKGEAEIAAANAPQIRLLQIPNTYSPVPLDTFDAKWQVCSPETVADFSAVGYFFGRELLKELKVPVGLVSADWGGTPAEAWTPLETLKSNPAYSDAVKQYDEKSRLLAENPNLGEKLQADYDDFMKKIEALTDAPPPPKPEWFDPKVSIPNTRTVQANKPFFEEADGMVQLRVVMELTEEQAKAGGAKLRLGRIDNYDVAWVNGAEVGRTGRDVVDNLKVFREYAIPGGTLKAGPNVVVLQIIDWFRTAIFGIQVNQPEIFWPDGKTVALPADWEMQEVVDLGKRPDTLDRQANKAGSFLYNGMIAPLGPAAFRGVIWYQGESNASRAEQYRTLFPDMINAWRKSWDRGNFPFYFVQLANLGNREGWPELREAQREALALPETGMAVTIDIGDPEDIHPGNKLDVGKRLALWALAKTYGLKHPDGSPLPHSGPFLREAVVGKGEIRLQFDHLNGGLKARDGGELKGFTLAAEDGEFFPAQARIEGDEVVVTREGMAAPLFVRYAWDANPDANLINEVGLPASPFRTDRQPFATE